MTQPIFNNYIDGYRTSITGNRSSMIADNAICSNVREAFPELTKDWSDQKVVNVYDEFAVSEMFGDNDARFQEFVKDLEDYNNQD